MLGGAFFFLSLGAILNHFTFPRWSFPVLEGQTVYASTSPLRDSPYFISPHFPQSTEVSYLQGLRAEQSNPSEKAKSKHTENKRVSRREKKAAQNKIVLRGPLDLNHASIIQLDALPGIGPSTAKAIVNYREQSGGFSSVSELEKVKGIGPKKLAGLMPHLVLQGKSFGVGKQKANLTADSLLP